MQKSILALILFALFLIPLYPVYAQSTATTSAGKPTTAIQRAQLLKNSIQASPTTVRDKIATKGAQLKEKLLKFRDQRKAKLAEKINDNLNKINERRTNQMMDHVSRLSNILSRLEERVNSAEANGRDMNSANTAIADANSKIASAEASVSAQKLKDYTIEATSEATIKADSAAMRNKLHSDLQSVHNLIVIARQAVANAISTAVSSAKGGGTP